MDKKNFPKGISVLICTYNGAKRLPKTLEHIVAQKMDKTLEWEVILVDNNSTDNSSEIARIFWKTHFTTSLKIISEPQQGLFYARKTAIKNAKFHYLLFCDDDNWLANDYLQKSFEYMEKNPNIGILGGKGKAVADINLPTWFKDVQHKYAVGKQGKEGLLPKGGSVYGAGQILNRTAYQDLIGRNFKQISIGRQGKKLTSGEDIELCLALQLIGYEIHYHSDLQFQHFMSADRLTSSYFKRMSEGMIESSFLNYAFAFAFRNVKFNTINYWLVSCYLLLKQTAIFIKNNLRKQSVESRLSYWHQYQTFWLFFKKSKKFIGYWKKINRL